MKKIDEWVRGILFVGAVIFAGLFFYLVVWNLPGQFIVLLAMSLLLVGTRITDLVSLKIGASGLETQLQRAIREAQVTVDQFRSLATRWAGIAILQVFAEGRWGGMSKTERRGVRNSIFAALRELEVPEADIAPLRDVEYRYTHFDYVSYVFKAVEYPNYSPEFNAAVEAFNGAHTGIGNEASPQELEEWLQRHNLLNGEVRGRLADYRHYEANREHRRLHVWEQ